MAAHVLPDKMVINTKYIMYISDVKPCADYWIVTITMHNGSTVVSRHSSEATAKIAKEDLIVCLKYDLRY